MNGIVIEQEAAPAVAPPGFETDAPAFGIWRDRGNTARYTCCGTRDTP